MTGLECHDLAKVFGVGGTQVRAFGGVDLAVASGEMVAIMGPSGSGKSTLLHILGALDVPTSGIVAMGDRRYDGLDESALTRLRRDRIGFVFQFFNLLPSLSAEENVLLPVLIAHRHDDAPRRRARELLEESDSSSFAWTARVGVRPLTVLRVVDQHAAGSGSMEGRLFGRLRVFRADDEHTTRSAAGRAALEAATFAPHALLADPRVAWFAESDELIVAGWTVGSERPQVQIASTRTGDPVHERDALGQRRPGRLRLHPVRLRGPRRAALRRLPRAERAHGRLLVRHTALRAGLPRPHRPALPSEVTPCAVCSPSSSDSTGSAIWPVRTTASPGLPTAIPPELLGGTWTPSDPTLLRAYGLPWAVVALAHVATAFAIRVQARRWPWLLAAVTLASLALVVVALWAAVAGLVIDIGLLAAAAWLIAKVRGLSR